MPPRAPGRSEHVEDTACRAKHRWLGLSLLLTPPLAQRAACCVHHPSIFGRERKWWRERTRLRPPSAAKLRWWDVPACSGAAQPSVAARPREASKACRRVRRRQALDAYQVRRSGGLLAKAQLCSCRRFPDPMTAVINEGDAGRWQRWGPDKCGILRRCMKDEADVSTVQHSFGTL